MATTPVELINAPSPATANINKISTLISLLLDAFMSHSLT